MGGTGCHAPVPGVPSTTRSGQRAHREESPMGISQVSPEALAAAVAEPSRHVRHAHAWDGGLSRRQFLHKAGVAAGVAVAATPLRPALAFADDGSVAPRPIPYGLPGSVFDPTNTHFYH